MERLTWDDIEALADANWHRRDAQGTMLNKVRAQFHAYTVELAAAQATVEALQRQVMHLDKTLADVYAQRDGLQRERDHAKKMEAMQKEVADNQTWYVRELRTALSKLQALVLALLETWVNGRKIHDGIPMTLRQQIDATLDATTPPWTPRRQRRKEATVSKWCGDENCLQCVDKEPDPYVHLPREEYNTLRDERERLITEYVRLFRLCEPIVKMLSELSILPIGCSREQELAWKMAVKNFRHYQRDYAADVLLQAALTPGEGGQDE